MESYVTRGVGPEPAGILYAKARHDIRFGIKLSERHGLKLSIWIVSAEHLFYIIFTLRSSDKLILGICTSCPNKTEDYICQVSFIFP